MGDRLNRRQRINEKGKGKLKMEKAAGKKERKTERKKQEGWQIYQAKSASVKFADIIDNLRLMESENGTKEG